jgi:predicted ATPase
VLDIAYGTRRCISTPSVGRPLGIALPETRLGRTLWGGYLAESYGGLLEIVVGGRQVATLRSQRGWHRFRVDTTPFAGTERDLTLRLNGESIVCVDLKID